MLFISQFNLFISSLIKLCSPSELKVVIWNNFRNFIFFISLDLDKIKSYASLDSIATDLTSNIESGIDSGFPTKATSSTNSGINVGTVSQDITIFFKFLYCGNLSLSPTS